MPYAMIRGAKTAYDLAGPEDGPPIVLLHSVGLSTRQGWRNQVPVLAAAGWRVLTYDFRGLGESGQGTERAEVGTFVQDLAALLDHVGFDRPVLMGVSLGGFVAQAFALAHRDRVRALVLVSTACRIPAGNSGARAERNSRIREAGMSAAAGPQIESHFPAEFIADSPGIVDWYRHHYLANDPGTYVGIMEDLGRFDTCDRLGRIRCPVLVVAGGSDSSSVAGATPGDSARRLADGIPGARLAIIDGAHHYPQIDHGPEFDRVVGAFLDEVRADTRAAETERRTTT